MLLFGALSMGSLLGTEIPRSVPEDYYLDGLTAGVFVNDDKVWSFTCFCFGDVLICCTVKPRSVI